MNSLKKLVNARWFPTVSKPLLSGLAASGIVYGLHALGITNGVVPSGVNTALEPLIGFLTTAIVQNQSGAAPAAPTGPSLGSQVAQMLLGDITQAIDADPSVKQALIGTVLERVLHPVQTPSIPLAGPAAQEVITTGNEAVSH